MICHITPSIFCFADNINECIVYVHVCFVLHNGGATLFTNGGLNGLQCALNNHSGQKADISENCKRILRFEKHKKVKNLKTRQKIAQEKYKMQHK